MRTKKWLYFGIALILCCPILGLIPTLLSVNGSFEALHHSEGSGLGNVEAGIRNALIWTVLGLFGGVVGIVVVVVSLVKSKRAEQSNAGQSNSRPNLDQP